MFRILFVVLVILTVSGCTHAGADGYTAGDIRGINHTSNIINYVKVNGRGGPNISAYGDGGGYCCVMLPRQWTPGLKARIDWEVDPNTAPAPPGYEYWEKYLKWEKAAKSTFRKYSTVVDIPEYGKSRCGITVHFLPCNQVKVTTACVGYGTPNYPIKEPMNMKEPAQCPQ